MIHFSFIHLLHRNLLLFFFFYRDVYSLYVLWLLLVLCYF